MTRRSPRYHSPAFKAKVALAALKEGPSLKELHAKIGQQALEIDFLAAALGKLDGPSGKR